MPTNNEPQPEPDPDDVLLVSDIDDTLTGDDAALAELTDAINRHRPRIRIVVNSSRPYDSVRGTLRDVFPASFRPDGIITAMGTQMRLGDAPVAEWHDRFAGWPRESIVGHVTALGHRAHDPEFQTEHKASFAVPRGEAQEEVARVLGAHNLPCRIIASGADDLDILPPGAGKDHATLFITHLMGYGVSQLIVAGDSANDLAMFEVAPRSIAVGNARAELIEAAPRERAYHAKANHAAGVLEGLAHYRAVSNPS